MFVDFLVQVDMKRVMSAARSHLGCSDFLHIHTHTHIHAYIYTYTYIYIYIHTYSWILASARIHGLTRRINES